LVAAFAGLSAGAASAAQPTPVATGTSVVSVVVPAPTPTSTTTPWTPPPVGTPPPGTGAAAGRGGSAGGASSQPGTTGGPGSAAEPAIPRSPVASAAEATVDKDLYVRGDDVTVRFDGLTPGEQVQIVLYSDPQLIANVPAGGDGVLTHTFALPADLPVGMHTVQLTGWESTRVGAARIFVTASATAAAADGSQGVPPWVWWAGGGLGALLLVVGGWWVTRAMRAPAGTEATA